MNGMYDTFEELFRNRLTELRMNKEVSARDMSLSIGQNPGYINNIETGKSLPSMTVFFYICEYLDVTPAEFFQAELHQPSETKELLHNISQLNTTQFDAIQTLIMELIK